MTSKFTTKQVADRLELTTNTIRNWTADFGDFLGESARPGSGPERRFVAKDVTILGYIKQLKGEGMREADVRQRLSETKFSDTEVLAPEPAPAPPTQTQPQTEPQTPANQPPLAANVPELAPPAQQESHQQAAAVALVQAITEAQNARFVALEQARQAQDERIRDWGTRRQSVTMAFVLGMTSGLVLAFSLLAIAIWIWR